MKVWPEILDFLIKSHSAPLYELSSNYSEKNLPATNGLFGTNGPMYIFYTYFMVIEGATKKNLRNYNLKNSFWRSFVLCSKRRYLQIKNINFVGFLEMKSKNIPNRQQCVGFQK